MQGSLTRLDGTLPVVLGAGLASTLGTFAPTEAWAQGGASIELAPVQVRTRAPRPVQRAAPRPAPRPVVEIGRAHV